MADSEDQTLGVKVGTVVLTLAAGWVAQRVVSVVWAKATGHDAPEDVDDEEIGIVSAVSFAAVAAVVGVLARRFAGVGARRIATRLSERG